MRALFCCLLAAGFAFAQSPSLTNVQNNSSLIPDGFANSGISPSSLFVVHGKNMADPAAPLVLQDVTNTPLPTKLNGASLSVTVNGVKTTPGIYYTSPTQIAAVLPANTPAGTGTITVTYNDSTSAAIPIKVVPSAFGIDVYNGNLAVVQDSISPTGALITPINSAKPGQIVTVWGTGLGADPADSDTAYTSTPHTIATTTDIFVGGVKASNIAYQGASVYPGVHIVVFTIPPGVPNGCYVPLAIVTGGNILSNMPTMPVMDNGGVCSEPVFGVTGTQIASLNGQSTIKTGSLLVAGGGLSFASAVFTSGSGSGFSAGTATLGTCNINEFNSNAGGVPSTVGLDAGTINLTGPGGNYPLPASSKGFYSANLAAGAIPSAGGSFTFNGNGGADIGKFTATISIPAPLMAWTNQSAAANVNRSQGLTVTWSGGAPGSYVVISGSATANGATGSFACYAPQSALQFALPAFILSALPAGSGFTTVQNVSSYGSFTAPGLDRGSMFALTSTSVNGVYQ